jgi:hypothetical protein
VRKRKFVSEEEESSEEHEEGECSESENDDISDQITPDVYINSESDHEEEQG